MKILDPDGNELPPGELGEVFMRPPEGVTTYRYIGAEAKALDTGGSRSATWAGWTTTATCSSATAPPT